MNDLFFWIVSIFGLFLSIFWTQVIYMSGPEPVKRKELPSISIIVPAWNEQKALPKTIDSLMVLDYPADKINVIIVNHGSTDNTKQVARNLLRKYKERKILLVNIKRKPGQSKASAMNVGLKYANGEFVGCMDADSVADKEALLNLIPFFSGKEVGAVISAIKVTNTKTMWGKLQRLEYLFAQLVRELMSKIDTLHVTPGALSLYRLDLIKRLGGFDENSLTEDYEIAMRLRYHGYTIKMAIKSISYTAVPDTFRGLWKQRVRWFRGFIETAVKYKKMFGNKKFGMMGVFQYPVNILTFITVISGFSIVSYELFSKGYNLAMELFALKAGVFDVLKMPSWFDILMHVNVNILFPMVLSFSIAIYIYHMAHKVSGEKWKYPLILLIYLFLYPILRSFHWITAVYKETFGVSKKW
ncbi:glycosyltransferase family 2 protein [Candidatus Woesearchaeota archaeon]|nr:glycosyltransferase family 2 protein [Candidatus Woesearchaeota archaeon]